MTDISIHPQLKSALQPLAPDELEQLEKNIVTDGRIIAPLLYWHDGEKNWLVDGHHRYQIATKHRLPYRAEPMPTMTSLDECRLWIFDHHCGRRNFADKLAIRKQRGELYLALKQQRGGDRRTDPAETPSGSKGQNEPLIGGGTAAAVAAQHHASPSTVKRDAKLVKSLEKLAPAIKSKYEAGDLKLPDEIVHALASVSDEDQMLIAREVRVSRTTWKDACRKYGALERKPESPPKAVGNKKPSQEPVISGGDKGKRTDSPAADFSPPKPPELLNEARELFWRMTPAQREQCYALWGEWLADSKSGQDVATSGQVAITETSDLSGTDDKSGQGDGEQPQRKRKTFQKPTVEEIQQYCFDRNNGISGQEFFDFYQTRGWKLNRGVPMTDWQAAVRTWEKNERERKKTGRAAALATKPSEVFKGVT